MKLSVSAEGHSYGVRQMSFFGKGFSRLFGWIGKKKSGSTIDTKYNKEKIFRHEVIIYPDTFFAYRVFIHKLEKVEVEVEVLQGGNIDCIVVNEYNFGKYVMGEDFIYYLTGSVLNIRKINYFFIPDETGMYYFVIDNTYLPELGARPDRSLYGGRVIVKFMIKSHAQVQIVYEKPIKV